MRFFNFEKLETILNSGTHDELVEFCNSNKLIIKDGCIYPSNKVDADDAIEYWDKLQYSKKINLNAAYGALLNNGCRFNDKRLGQSTTLSGRQIVKHMTANVNETVDGEYDYLGKSIIYNDSVVGDSMIITSYGRISIEELYQKCQSKYNIGTKEYANDNIEVMGFDLINRSALLSKIDYVMRHYTTKDLYKFHFSNHNHITVTQDHSLMILRDESIIELKPEDIRDDDLFICLNDDKTIEYVQFLSRTCLGTITDYVYDISIKDGDHVFFANECLVHNTDSCHKDSIIDSNWGKQSIEYLFNNGDTFWTEDTDHGIKEYSSHPELKVSSYDNDINQSYYDNINYIYRHKVSKEQWEIEDEFGNTVIVTGDHSIMIERSGSLIEVKPSELLDTDLLIVK
jgi:hypothetical protein